MTIENRSQQEASVSRLRARSSRAGDTKHMSRDMEPKLSEAVAAHRRWRYHGRRQGAECECYAIFYPATGRTAAIIDAHRQHTAEALASAGFGSVVIMRQWLEENQEVTA